MSTGVSDVNEKAIAIANEFKPDIIFMQIQAPGVIHNETVRQMKETGTFIINWNGDIRHHTPEWMISMADYVDRTLFSNMRDARNVKNGGYLEIGYDPEIYKPEGETLPCREIAFFGNNYGANRFPLSMFRIEMHNLLTRQFGSKYGAYGNWSNAAGNFNSSQHDEAAAYRSCKIAINVSHFEEENYSSDRILRILGTGVFCLCKWYPEMPYIDGVHVKVFKTLPELLHLIRHYSNDTNKPERDRIARQGQEFVRNTFTFDHMVTNIIKYYEQN
jgi:spore maturation protein CgeB